MFGFLFRRSRPATRFVPRLEVLDGRVLPGGLSGGVVLGTHGPAVCGRGGTEEIPQALPGGPHAAVPADRAGDQVTVFGGSANSGVNW